MDVPLNQPPAPQAVVIKNEASSTHSPMKLPSSPNVKVLITAVLMFLLVSGIGVGVFLARNRTQLSSNAAAANVTLDFSPDQITGEVNKSYETTIKIDTKDQSVGGVDLYLNFDPQIITVESFEVGTFLQKSLGQAEIGNGTAGITIIPDISKQTMEKGQGDLAKLKFKVIQSAQTASEITIDKTKTKIAADGQDTNALGTTQKMVISFGSASPSPENSPTASPSSPIASAQASTSPTTSTTPLPSFPLGTSPSPISSSSPTSSPSSTSSATPLPSIAASPTTNKKDFNGDGKVNSIDLSFMYSAWGIPKTDNLKKADLNSDGVVNGIDYSLFLPGFSP